MRELSTELFASIVKGADEEIAFDRAIKEKMEKALEIHKVGLASSIFNNVPSTDEEVGQLEKDGYEVHESDDLENTTPDITEKAKNFLTKGVTEVKESDELEESKYDELGLSVNHNLNMAQTFWWKLSKGSPKSPKKTFLATLTKYIQKNKVTYKKTPQPNPTFPEMYTLTFKDKSTFQAWVPVKDSKVKDIQIGNADHLAINGTRGNMFHKVIKANDLKLKLKEDQSPIIESTPVNEVELEEARNWWTVTITKKVGKLFKGQTVDVKATSLSDAIKKGLKQMKANPALVPSDAVDAELAESKFTEELEEATLKKVEGSPANIQKDFKDLITKAKTIKGVTDDEYMRWYASMDEKIYLKWDKMVKAIPQYKKAYKLGIDGASGVSPFPKGTLASAIWSNEKAAGEMDA